MFTFSGLRSGLYFSLKTTSSVRCARLRTRAEQLLLVLNQALLKRISSRDQWNLTPATMCRGSAARAVRSRRFGAADHARAQMWPRQILTRTFSKHSHMQPFWSPFWALAQLWIYKSQLWVYIMPFWEKKVRVVRLNSCSYYFIFELVTETSFHRFERVKTNPFNNNNNFVTFI